jgi:methyltransferase-like protein
MFASTLGAAAEAALDGLGDQVVQEQYMDFLRLRAFRQTLFVRADAQPCLEIDLERLYDFSIHADLTPLQRVHLNRVKRQEYATADGGRLQVEHPLTKAVLEGLALVYPNAMPLGPLMEAAAKEVAGTGGRRYANDRDACLSELFNLYISQGIGLTQRAARWPHQVGAWPRATPLARAQAASGEGHVASVRHRSLGLDALSARLLMLLDGTRDLNGLLTDLAAEIRTDPELAAAPGSPGEVKGQSEQIAPASLERLLGIFARAGLLAADVQPRDSEPGAQGRNGTTDG